jgi:metal-responsive CopG/Arc/MetJ family transcriptional regulator
MVAKKEKRPRGRPQKEDAMGQISIWLPKPMLDMLDEAVADRLDGKKRSDLIRELLAEALEARSKGRRGSDD